MHGTPMAILATVAAFGLVAAVSPPAVTARAAAMPSDFNGDGYADLAIGAPGEVVGGKRFAGSVNVLYGSEKGLTAAGDQYWTQATPGVKGKAHRGGKFGRALASGDFNGDGYADLAIGVPWDGSGAVNVLFGSKRGLTAAGDQRWTLHGGGEALAAADFDGDGYWDLAIGAHEGAGLVEILYGGPGGLTAARTTRLNVVMTGAASAGSGFGRTLAAGDLDGDGLADLAVGATFGLYLPVGEDAYVQGYVGVFFGTLDGVSAEGSQLWSQVTPGLEDDLGTWDYFGDALAIGDFDADGIGDLAIGVAGETLDPSSGTGSGRNDGRVVVLHGTPTGPTAEGAQSWHREVPGIPTDTKWFGSALAVGHFDADPYADLAIGSPWRTIGGSVVVLRGTAAGLSAIGAQSWSQASPGVPGSAERGDAFGESLASADYGRSGRDDLAIGNLHENIGGARDAGSVTVLYGRAAGLSARHAQRWSQRSPGVRGTAEDGDWFGWRFTP